MANGFGIIIIFFPHSKTKKKFFVLSFPLFFVTVCVLFIIFFALESGMYYKIKWEKETRENRKWFYIYTHACIDTVIEAKKKV